MEKPHVIAICGPTASGKSELALSLAGNFDAEIICMDSMQIYRRMDIGTAKPTDAERQMVAHHMLDIVEPTEPYTVADYAVEAERVILEIASRGKTPILVGGTGLYLKALMHGMSLGGAKSDEALRARYRALAQEEDGKERLHAMLEQIDPPTAKRLHPNDVRRVIRALEIYELTGVPMSRQQTEEPQRPFRILPLAIELPREVLYERLEKRVYQMMRHGLLQEVRSLLESGVSPDAQAMQGIGYKELIPVALGQCDEAPAVRQIIINTRHYAKRQGTWMRTEPQTVWLPSTGAPPAEAALRHASAFLSDLKGTSEA